MIYKKPAKSENTLIRENRLVFESSPSLGEKETNIISQGVETFEDKEQILEEKLKQLESSDLSELPNQQKQEVLLSINSIRTDQQTLNTSVENMDGQEFIEGFEDLDASISEKNIEQMSLEIQSAKEAYIESLLAELPQERLDLIISKDGSSIRDFIRAELKFGMQGMGYVALEREDSITMSAAEYIKALDQGDDRFGSDSKIIKQKRDYIESLKFLFTDNPTKYLGIDDVNMTLGQDEHGHDMYRFDAGGDNEKYKYLRTALNNFTWGGADRYGGKKHNRDEAEDLFRLERVDNLAEIRSNQILKAYIVDVLRKEGRGSLTGTLEVDFLLNPHSIKDAKWRENYDNFDEYYRKNEKGEYEVYKRKYKEARNELIQRITDYETNPELKKFDSKIQKLIQEDSEQKTEYKIKIKETKTQKTLRKNQRERENQINTAMSSNEKQNIRKEKREKVRDILKGDSAQQIADYISNASSYGILPERIARNLINLRDKINDIAQAMPEDREIGETQIEIFETIAGGNAMEQSTVSILAEKEIQKEYLPEMIKKHNYATNPELGEKYFTTNFQTVDGFENANREVVRNLRRPDLEIEEEKLGYINKLDVKTDTMYKYFENYADKKDVTKANSTFIDIVEKNFPERYQAKLGNIDNYNQWAKYQAAKGVNNVMEFSIFELEKLNNIMERDPKRATKYIDAWTSNYKNLSINGELNDSYNLRNKENKSKADLILILTSQSENIDTIKLRENLKNELNKTEKEESLSE